MRSGLARYRCEAVPQCQLPSKRERTKYSSNTTSCQARSTNTELISVAGPAALLGAGTSRRRPSGRGGAATSSSTQSDATEHGRPDGAPASGGRGRAAGGEPTLAVPGGRGRRVSSGNTRAGRQTQEGSRHWRYLAAGGGASAAETRAPDTRQTSWPDFPCANTATPPAMSRWQHNTNNYTIIAVLFITCSLQSP